MKNFLAKGLFILALTGLFSGCSKDDDVEPEIVYGEATLLTFGFYAQDNPDVIYKDYIATAIAGNITIQMPSEVDKSSLIARFETSADDKVMVGGVDQNSGITANNYIAPVDFIVNEGTNNTKYTVTVDKLPSAVWTNLPLFTTDIVKELVLRVNPVSQIPCLAYVVDADEYVDQKASVVALTDGAWNSVGATGFTKDRTKYMAFDFDATGKPYVAFADYNNVDGDGDQFYPTSMMAFDGTSWDYVGSKGITDVKINDVTLGFDAENTPYTFSINYAAGSNAGKREVNVMKYDGNWSASSIPGRAGYSKVVKTKSVNGNLYVAVLDYGEGQSVSVYQYDGSSWSTLANKLKGAPENVIYYYNISMDVDAKGNVYIAYAEDNAGDKAYALKIQKYTKADETWSMIGDAIITANRRMFDVAVSPAGTPVFIYTDDQKYPVALSFDTDVNNWGAINVLEAAECSNLNMVMSNQGVGYACYTVSDAVKVMKYDTPVQ